MMGGECDGVTVIISLCEWNMALLCFGFDAWFFSVALCCFAPSACADLEAVPKEQKERG